MGALTSARFVGLLVGFGLLVTGAIAWFIERPEAESLAGSGVAVLVLTLLFTEEIWR